MFLSVWSLQPQGHVLQLSPAQSRRLADSLILLLFICMAVTWATGNPTMQHPSAYYYRQQGVTRPKAPRSSNMSSSLCIRKCHQASLQNMMSPDCPPPKNDKINRAPPVTLQSLDSKDKMRPTHRPDYQLAINCNWPQAYGYLEGCTKVTFKILFTLSLGPNTHIHHPS